MKKKNNPILFSLGLAFTLMFCVSDFTEDSIMKNKETQVYDYHSNEANFSHTIKNINDLNT